MRLHSPLDDIIRGRGTLRVLRRFCQQPKGKFTAGELGKLEHLALSHVQSALANLEGHGIVDRSVSGRTHLWSLVEGNLLVEPLTTLFQVERELPTELDGELKVALSRLPIRRAILFGSVLRGEESGWSDVDLYLELLTNSDRDRVFEAIAGLAHQVRERFGLNLSPIVAPSKSRGEGLSPEFVARLEQTGKFLIGSK